jgi:hypothetical protein
LLVASCANSAPPADDLRARQEAAYTTVIAAHIGRPPVDVASRWLSEAEGIAKVEARDGNRPHICDVDASSQVLGYIHPGA